MSLISIDFENIRHQIDRLRRCSEEVLEAAEKMADAEITLDDMEFGNDDLDDEIKSLEMLLKRASEALQRDADKLERAAELYEECELVNKGLVDDLPFNMPEFGKSRINGYSLLHPVIKSMDHHVVGPGGTPFGRLRTGSFSGHAVLNDEWLEELMKS